MAAPRGIKKATKFNRIFDAEFLQARKDITPLELSCAMGKVDEVIAGIKADDNPIDSIHHVIQKRNRDGNTLLLLAVANGHVPLTRFLLEVKSNMHQKNASKLDVLDYAVIDSVRSNMAKEVLSHCDYVVTEVFDGPFEKASKVAIQDLLAAGYNLARTTLLGKRPDFSQLFSRETEYRKEWVANFGIMAKVVRKGVLLVDDDIGYLERDALLSGALEVPLESRYLYSATTQRITKFTHALQGEYEQNLEKRLSETSYEGDAMAVQGLLKARATPNAENLRGESVLHSACHTGDAQTIKCLLVAKASLNATNKDGYGAMHCAACLNKPEAVSILLRAKADMFARSNKGHSVLDFVKHEGHTAVLQLLQEERDARKGQKVGLKR
jgi:ankyrin repeat protein